MREKIKKIFPYIMILTILLGIGLFGSAGKARAVNTAPPDPDGSCQIRVAAGVGGVKFLYSVTHVTKEGDCTTSAAAEVEKAKIQFPSDNFIAETHFWVKSASPTESGGSGQSDFETAVLKEGCNLAPPIIPGCAKAFFYYVVYTPSAVILTIAAKFFNALIKIALDSTMISSSTFVPTAWAVVRDLSNLFFILILLYIAIQIILDLGGHDAKKMIAKVIIIALLINFSMFFTQVIIDSSNILALIFYNKLDVTYKNSAGQTVARPDDPSTSGEKDLSGKMYQAFDPTSKLDTAFWDNARGVGTASVQPSVPASTMIGIICVAAAIMLFAAYAFFISGIAFVARLIELWVLIIFSPFAFMSSTVPLFSGVEYIGWNAWFKRLLKVAFMAPIFMLFMYLIFLLLQPPGLFGNLITTNKTWIQTLLFLLIPAMVILVLLLKATEYAKKGSGVIGEKLMAGAKMVGGLALGAATGGTAFLASNSAGRIARNIANDDELKKKAATGDKGAQRKLALANSFANKSFDIRQTGLGKLAAKQSGMDFNQGLGAVGLGTENLKGGRKGRDKEKIEKGIETKKSYHMSEANAGKQERRAAQYESDKNAAKNKQVEPWEERYKEELANAKRTSQGPINEEEFRKDYEKNSPRPEFDENKFRKDYEKTGSVKNSKDINKERDEAYALSLENPNKKIEDGKAIKKGLAESFGNSFGAGIKDPRIIAATAAATALAGPLGLLTPIIGGLSYAIKDIVKASAQAHIPLFAEHEDVVAGIRKGPDEYKEWLKKVQKDIKDGGSSATTNPPKSTPPASPAPAEKPGDATGNTGTTR